MDRFASPVRASTAARAASIHRSTLNDGGGTPATAHNASYYNNSGSNSDSSYVRPTPYSLGLAALISLHNHAEGTALQYASEEEVEQINVFLQNVFFFPPPQQQQQHLRELVCSLHTHLYPASTSTDRTESSPRSIPQQLLQWISAACATLDAFFDFCTTVADPTGGTSTPTAYASSSQTIHASAAALFQRSVGLALQGSGQQMTESNGEGSMMTTDGTTSFRRVTKLYTVLRTQVREAAVALEALEKDPTTAAVGTATVSTVVENIDTPTASSSSASSQQPWRHFMQQLHSNERVGAIDALHAYMDHHGECLGTAGFLQVGVAAHFGASTTVARREAERVVQQHPSSVSTRTSPSANASNSSATTTANTPGADRANAATNGTTATTPAAINAVVYATGAAVMTAGNNDEDRLPLDDYDVDSDTMLLPLRMPTTPAEQRAAGINRALATIYGPLTTTASDTTEQCRRYPLALKILQDMPATDDVAYYLLQHEWATRRCEWADADHWMAALESSAALPSSDSPLYQDVVSQKAFGLAYRGKWQAAARLLQQQKQAEGEAKQKQPRNSRHLLQLAEIYVYAKQHTAALPPILHHLAEHPRDAPGLILLATIQLEFLQDAVRANQLVRAALPLALQKAHVAWQAQAYWVLARCQQDQQRMGAAVALERAIQLFESLDDTHRLLPIWNHAARWYHAHNDDRQRDRAAEAWLRLRKQQKGDA